MIPNHPLFRKLAPLEAYIVPIVVALVGLGAFGLGRLSAGSGEHPTLRVLYPEAMAAVPLANTAAVAATGMVQPSSATATQGLGNYVASKNGTKYYLTTCSSSNRIKPENKVYFASASEAVAAGYGPAANCPGL